MNSFSLEGFDFAGFDHLIITPGKIPPGIPGRIRRNPKRNISPLRVNQVHGGIVHRITKDSVADFETPPPGDGIITDLPEIPLAVATADCVPLFAIEESGEFCGVIHCGWRSVAAGIVENAMAVLRNSGAEIGNLHFAMGPAILGDEYEVGPEVAQIFPDSTRKLTGGKYLLDLPSEIERRLRKSGAGGEIIPPPLSTYSSEWLPSYRREGEKAGRMLSVVRRIR